MTSATGESGVAVIYPEHNGAEGLPEHSDLLAGLRARAGITEPWHLAVLGVIGRWSLPWEDLDDRRWRYIIGGEALDWVTLAQRLCLEIPDAVPSWELDELLFHGRLPDEIDPAEFRQLIGPYRYSAHLNFWYGVVVEEALQLVTEDAIRKSRLARCYGDTEQVVEEAYRHLYGDSRANLICEFHGIHAGEEWAGDLWPGEGWAGEPIAMSLTAWHEFTYWLFKRRIRKWHPARVASDTKRGLERLRELRSDDRGRNPGLDPGDGGLVLPSLLEAKK